MKKKEIRERDKPGFWPIVILVAIIVIGSGVFYGTVYGASYNHPINVTQDPRHDSTLIVVYSDSANEKDSTIAYNDTLLVLNDIYNYTITEIDFWDGQAGYGYDDAPTVLRQAYSTGAGSGADTVVLRFQDSTVGGGGTTPVIGAGFAVLNSSSAVVASGTSADTGKFTVNLNAGAYTVRTTATGFMWDTYDLTVAGDADTDTVGGYAIVTDTPTVANTSIMEGFLKKPNFIAIEGAIITAVRYEGVSAIIDTAAIPSILPRLEMFAVSDTLGYFNMTLRGTSSYPDTSLGFYNISATRGGVTLFSIEKLWVPSSGTWNIADSLVGRQ